MYFIMYIDIHVCTKIPNNVKLQNYAQCTHTCTCIHCMRLCLPFTHSDDIFLARPHGETTKLIVVLFLVGVLESINGVDHGQVSSDGKRKYERYKSEATVNHI